MVICEAQVHTQRKMPKKPQHLYLTAPIVLTVIIAVFATIALNALTARTVSLAVDAKTAADVTAVGTAANVKIVKAAKIAENARNAKCVLGAKILNIAFAANLAMIAQTVISVCLAMGQSTARRLTIYLSGRAQDISTPLIIRYLTISSRLTGKNYNKIKKELEKCKNSGEVQRLPFLFLINL